MQGSARILLCALILLAGARSARGHHSFAATYFEDKQATIEGTLAAFQYRNPHSFLHVMAPDPKTKKIVKWAVEWGGAGQLKQQGVTTDSLKVGDKVVITGSPSRNGDFRLRMRTISRPKDGWRWGGHID